ncbi:MAG TPA: GGDEF domain-containing protein [Solimonas sp.]|nr:GGDEF domain-containing protein [Solimonas sp.]
MALFDVLQAELRRSWRPWGFGNPGLEQAYNDQSRPRRARRRMRMFAIALAAFGLAPLYGRTLLETPELLVPLYRTMELLLLIPMSALGLFLNLRYPHSTLVTAYTAGASLGVIVVLVMLRVAGTPLGFGIPFELVAICMIIVAMLSGLRSWQTLTGIALATPLMLGMEYQLEGLTTRFWWSTITALVAVSFASVTEINLDLTSRRAWLAGQLAELSGMRDLLTRLPNRAWFDRDAPRVLRQALREREPVAVLLFDLDHFKLLNDSLGHAAGDACLQRVGQLLSTRFALRPLDLCARIGGEEFVLLLYGCSLEGARQVARQLVEEVRGLRIANPGSLVAPHVTVSVGLVQRTPAEAQDVWELVAAADHRLYEAKRQGRNRWCE